jgi:2'-5' RNA ligase
MRLFIAIHFSPEVKRLLLRTIESLRAQAAGGNFTREENLHLTLAFLGATINESAARAAIAAAAAPPFPLTVGGSGRSATSGGWAWKKIRRSPRSLPAFKTSCRARLFHRAAAL